MNEVGEFHDRDLEMLGIERAMLSHEQVYCPVENHFAPGVYLREMFAPAGTLILGHKHRESHACVLMKGVIKIFDGDTTVVLSAPMIFIAPAGRKLGLVIEDIVFVNIHANPTNEQDLDVLSSMYVEKSDASILEIGEKSCPG